MWGDTHGHIRFKKQLDHLQAVCLQKNIVMTAAAKYAHPKHWRYRDKYHMDTPCPKNVGKLMAHLTYLTNIQITWQPVPDSPPVSKASLRSCQDPAHHSGMPPVGWAQGSSHQPCCCSPAWQNQLWWVRFRYSSIYYMYVCNKLILNGCSPPWVYTCVDPKRILYVMKQVF